MIAFCLFLCEVGVLSLVFHELQYRPFCPIAPDMMRRLSKRGSHLNCHKGKLAHKWSSHLKHKIRAMTMTNAGQSLQARRRLIDIKI